MEVKEKKRGRKAYYLILEMEERRRGDASGGRNGGDGACLDAFLVTSFLATYDLRF